MNPVIMICFSLYLLFNSQGVIDNNYSRFYKLQVDNHIDLTISEIKGTKGLLLIGVFENENGYPDQPAFNYSLAKDTLKNGMLRLRIPIKSAEKISISVLDDENMNGKMDYKVVVMPKEGFGFSNNPKITSRKAPPFNVTSFRFTGLHVDRSVSLSFIKFAPDSEF